MKYAYFLIALVALSCSEERLRLKSNINELESVVFTAGTTIQLTVEHTGNGIFISKKGKVISDDSKLTIDDSFAPGREKLQISTYNRSDTLSFDFYVLVAPDKPVKQLEYEVVATYPHPPELFTQGLVLDESIVIESSGQYGQSALSTYVLGSNDFIQQRKTASNLFAEGLALLNDSLYQISWQEGKCLIYSWDGNSFTYAREMDYTIREGWGLSAHEEHLLWTDGTEKIRWVNPRDLSVDKTVTAISHTGILGNLNELEMYKDRLACNLWHLSKIVFIDPETGVCDRELDVSEIANIHASAGTLNGIATKGDHLLITGKNWPVMYEIRVDGF